MNTLPGQVVVITGASSGIGRLAALRFADAGAQVVAAARDERALAALEEEAAGSAGSLEAVPTDVTDVAAVERLARTTVERRGRIDTWINAAAVAIWARADETTPDEYRRLLEVNVMGVVHGSLAALAVMRPADHGTIVNVGSVESMRAMPLQAAYAASKHAVKGFTEALRSELEHDGSSIAAVLVMPSSIDTPIFRHARSRLGVLPRPHPPVYDPDVVVEALLAVAEKPVPRVVVGGGGAGLVLLERLSPRVADLALRVTGWRGQRSERPDDAVDNLDGPLGERGDIRGSWGDEARSTSWYTRYLAVHPARARIATVAVAVAALLALRRVGRG